MEEGWEDECAAQMEDSHVDETLRANEYEFTVEGAIV